MSGMSIDFESALVWFDCVLCNGSGSHGGEPCECSGGMYAVYIGTWLANLAIGAALCRAFTLGARRGFDVGAFMAHVSDEWFTGCGRSAP